MTSPLFVTKMKVDCVPNKSSPTNHQLRQFLPVGNDVYGPDYDLRLSSHAVLRISLQPLCDVFEAGSFTHDGNGLIYCLYIFIFCYAFPV